MWTNPAEKRTRNTGKLIQAKYCRAGCSVRSLYNHTRAEIDFYKNVHSFISFNFVIQLNSTTVPPRSLRQGPQFPSAFFWLPGVMRENEGRSLEERDKGRLPLTPSIVIMHDMTSYCSIFFNFLCREVKRTNTLGCNENEIIILISTRDNHSVNNILNVSSRQLYN
jgi:hypothetical protein